ncbi:MAG: hypothetical protein ORN51_11990 [Akkermansiaceae bacterium]|nr:hypothetical protein [Akkermansiaceae bacterium]
MQAPNPIEEILARLMPPALSQSRQFEIEEMIDELAGPDATTHAPLPSPWWRSRMLIGSGIAAALATLCAFIPSKSNTPIAQTTHNLSPISSSEMVLISESDRIESMTDEGWQDEADGSAMHALRVNAVGQNSLRDEESGMVVQISELREELLLTPISAF